MMGPTPTVATADGAPPTIEPLLYLLAHFHRSARSNAAIFPPANSFGLLNTDVLADQPDDSHSLRFYATSRPWHENQVTTLANRHSIAPIKRYSHGDERHQHLRMPADQHNIGAASELHRSARTDNVRKYKPAFPCEQVRIKGLYKILFGSQIHRVPEPLNLA